MIGQNFELLWSVVNLTYLEESFDKDAIWSILEYAQVLKMLGNGRLEAFCFDGTKRLCHIRGKLRKKVRKY